jgi:hypothetical protein
MSKYELAHVRKFDRISVRLSDPSKLSTVNGYLYLDSDKLGVYVYAFFSQNAVDDYYDALNALTLEEQFASSLMEDLATKYASPHYIPWHSVAYIQLH